MLASTPLQGVFGQTELGSPGARREGYQRRIAQLDPSAAPVYKAKGNGAGSRADYQAGEVGRDTKLGPYWKCEVGKAAWASAKRAKSAN